MAEFIDTNTRWKGIIIRCHPDNLYFPRIVEGALDKIASRRLGRSLLHSIHKRSHLLTMSSHPAAQVGYTVCIRKPGGPHVEVVERKVFNRWANKAVRINEQDATQRGVGTPTAVYWNPNLIRGDGAVRPPFIALAHELIHAMNNLRGTAFSNTCEEELKTVGLGRYRNHRKRNENAIRAEHGLPLRDRYTGFFPTNKNDNS